MEAFETFEEQLSAQEKTVREETTKLLKMHRSRPQREVADYAFSTSNGKVKLSELFKDKDELILIHNMGSSCPYCTLWADGFIGLGQHFQNRAAFVLTNNDEPQTQQQFAQNRKWPFPVVSAKGTTFTKDMGFTGKKDDEYWPGVSIFTKKDGKIYQNTRAPFGPGDLFCSLWNFFEMLPTWDGDWEPKYSYESSHAHGCGCSH